MGVKPANAPQTFGSCLRDLIAENGWQMDWLTEAAGYKSKTSVLRILREESSARNREQFFRRIDGLGLLRPEARRQLQDALEVSALGADKVCARRILRETIFGGDAPEAAASPEFCALLDEFRAAESGSLLLVNGLEGGILPALRGALAQNERLSLRHCFAVGESERSAAQAMRRVARVNCAPNYAGFAGLESDGPSDLPDLLAASARRSDGTTVDSLTVFREDGRADTFRLAGEHGLFAYVERSFARAAERCAPATCVCRAADGPEAFVSAMRRRAERERDRAADFVKFSLCASLIPTPVVRASLSGRSLRAAFPGASEGELRKCLERFLYYHLVCFRGMTEGRAPRRLALSRRGLESFAQTGLLGAHFAAMRPFSPQERRAALENLLALAVENERFSFALFRDGFEPKFEIHCWEGSGIMAVPAPRGPARTSGYCDGLLLHPRLADAFQEYFLQELLPQCALPEAESAAWLHAMVARLPED